MIERIYKNIKYIGLGFLILDALFVILCMVYFSLSLIGIIPFGIWFVIVCALIIALNVIFAILLLVIKKLKKF